MADRCNCKVVGCLCRRAATQPKCAGCGRGEHADSAGRVLCHNVPCRRRSVAATHRILFDQGAQPLCCRGCAREWNEHRVPTWSLNSEDERQRTQLLADLSEFYGETDALKWIRTVHPQLGGAQAMHLLGTARSAEVFAIIDQMRSGAYA